MRAAFAIVTTAMLVASGCSSKTADPLTLEGNRLTVDNRTSSDWNDVEIWLNRYFRITARSIPAGGRLQAPLDSFVSGYGQRFDFRRMQVTDLRLTARLPNGEPLEIKKQFEVGGLAGAVGRKE
jgi:hypothetical protein